MFVIISICRAIKLFKNIFLNLKKMLHFFPKKLNKRKLLLKLMKTKKKIKARLLKIFLNFILSYALPLAL